MYRFRRIAGAALLAALPLTSAQTFSVCNPMEKTDCPTQAGLNQAEFTADFTQGASAAANFTPTAGNLTWTPDGAEFKITQLGDGPTIQSNFMIMFGSVEVVMKCAPGAGIVSSFVMESDNLDEIDWEIIGSDTARAQSNYFGKGNTSTYDRGQFHNVATPQTSFHTYAVNWQNDTTTWSIDGQVVRTLNFADAVGGTNYPQTPMNIRLGNWVAGDPKNNPGTVQWAGGITDFSQGPFNMVIKSIKVTNANPAMSYKYGDQTGTWQSIQMLDVAATAKAITDATGPSDSTEPATVTVDLGSSATGLTSNSSSNDNGNAASGGKSTVTIGLTAATGASNSTNGGNGNAGSGGKSTVTIGLTAATGASNSTNGGNGNAGSGGKSTVTIDLTAGATGVSNSTSNGGLVGAGAASNATQATVTIVPGGAAASGGAAAEAAGAGSAGAAGATTFSLTSSTGGTQASAAAVSQFTGNVAAPTGVPQMAGALAGVLGLGLVLL